jgi:hypothetical protein
MPRWLQITLHAALVGVNIALAIKGVPSGWNTGLAVAQGALGAVAQGYNSDGTPQAVAFRKQ